MIRHTTCRYLPAVLLAGASTLLNTAATAQGIAIGSGAHLVLNGAANVQLVDAGLKNDGSLEPSSGTVRFSGSSATSPSISGAANTAFHALTLDRTGAPLVLDQSVQVGQNLNMVNGNIDLNGQVLDLGTTGMLVGERNASRVTGPAGGYIQSVATLNAPVAANPGNIGLEISSPADMGLTEFRRSHTPFDVSPLDQSINRYFNVTPTSNNDLGATLKMYYFEGELNSASEEDLQLWASTDAGTDWTLYGVNTIDTDDNFAVLNNVDTLSYVTLSTNIVNDTPLGLTLLNFDGKLEGSQVLLNWATVHEVATSHFELERSVNGAPFAVIGTVQAQGNAASHSYKYIDPAPKPGTNLYRLKMADLDTKYTYSQVVSIRVTDIPRNAVQEVFPNPALASVNVRLLSTEATNTTVSVFSVSGALMGQQQMELKEGVQVINLPVGNLAQGMYYIRFSTPGLADAKFMKE